ncbi:hypothetical protein HZB02_00505 [Candidatus Woesearchaeota archaeon]|nr:hypothetical protein [Candidatus Woesearchaeota archaeon]
MPAEVEFNDLGAKTKFKTTKYKIVDKRGRFFAVAKSPTGTYECWRVVGKDFAAKNK